MLSILQPKKILILSTLVFAVIVALCIYAWTTTQTVKTLQANVIALEVDKAQLATAINTQNNTISFLRTQARLIELEFNNTEQAFAQATRDAENLKKQLLARELDTLSKQSYNASQDNINATTAMLNRCYELLSGAPINEQEKSATSSQEFNYMCPWLYKP